MRRFLFNLANRIRSFFYGRNGFDVLAKHILIASIFVFLIYGFWPRNNLYNLIIKAILGLISYALMIYSYFRTLSKNINKRVCENNKYTGAIKMNKTKWQQRKTHKFFRCPKCKTWLRLPKGRGKITITCVKCSHKFNKRT